MQRRDFLGMSAIGALSVAAGRKAIAASPRAMSEGASALDEFLTGFMKKWGVPTGSAAVSKDGRLVYARAFGHADLAKTMLATPNHRFRIASSSKPITAVAIMKLEQEGRLSLEEPAFGRLRGFSPPRGRHEDPRLRTITVRQLLEHSGGFDSTKVDPQFDDLRRAADALGRPRPATHDDIIRYMMGQPLAFVPGTKYIYSNFGYNVLGRIIEQTTGISYAQYVKTQILAPAGVHRMELGRTKPQDRLPQEVQYWDDPYTPTYYSVYPDDLVPRTYSYGGFSMEAIDAHGGWVARPVDLTRFLDAVAGRTGTQLLSAQTVQKMLARPDLAQYRGSPKFYALGWDVVTGKVVMSHNGALTWGTASVIARLANGATYAICFNRLGYQVVEFIESLAHSSADVINGVSSWPDHDLYEQYA
jgi:CubicO group peptidase (beta-lactamase class C family)